MSIDPETAIWNPKACPVYLCFDAEDLYAARMVSGYPLANPNLDHYVARENAPLDGPAAEAIQAQLRLELVACRVLVCLIGPLTGENAWVGWEIEAAKGAAKRPSLVGALLDERHERPRALLDAGAGWVPFNRDHLERAVRWASTNMETRDDFEFRDMAW